jgi:hypothetical protein
VKEIIWDKWDMILQTGDGGDTAANMGTYHLFSETRRRMGHKVFSDGYYPRKDKEDFLLVLLKLEHPTKKGRGLYRRHPEPAFWGSRTNTMSRDQTIPLLCAMAIYGLRGQILKYMLGHLFRGFLFATNTTPNWSYPADVSGFTFFEKVKFFFGWDPGRIVYATKLPDLTLFEFWALELRGLYGWAVWPLFFPVLCFLDIWTLIGSFEKNIQGKDPSQSDDRNHVNSLLIGLQICPTPILEFAVKVYSKRPLAAGARPGVNGPQSALDHYYRADDSPPFNLLAEPIVQKFFTGSN